jgi:hypothetical protein
MNTNATIPQWDAALVVFAYHPGNLTKRVEKITESD